MTPLTDRRYAGFDCLLKKLGHPLDWILYYRDPAKRKVVDPGKEEYLAVYNPKTGWNWREATTIIVKRISHV